MHLTDLLSHSTTALSVQAHCVDFVDECESILFVGQIADLLDGRDASRHGINRLEYDHLGPGDVKLLQELLQMFQVIVAPHNPLGVGVPHS